MSDKIENPKQCTSTTVCVISESRQCWECLRRRHKCDMTRPVCSKCRAAGIVCPGYGQNKPLTWLTPGKVLSKPRLRKKEPKATVAVVKRDELRRDFLQDCGWIFQREIPYENDHIIRSIMYYNDIVFPRLRATQLAPNPYVAPLKELHLIPASALHAIVVLALSHRRHMLLTRGELHSELVCSIHHHTGLAIRSLNTDLDNDALRTSDKVIASIMVMLFVDVMYSLSQNWRAHCYALTAIIRHRGGLEKLTVQSPHLGPLLLSYLILQVTSNTTCPAAEQSLAIEHSTDIEMISKLYGLFVYPNFLCPPDLFTELIHINHLRSERAWISSNDQIEHETRANDVFNRVLIFSSEKWAASHAEMQDEWSLVAQLYHSAIYIYALLSIDLSSQHQNHAFMRERRKFHHVRLFNVLEKAAGTACMNCSMMWPLVVAGVEALHGSLEERALVLKILSDISGGYAMMATSATELLNRLWAGPKRANWDDCFDRPYALMV